MEQVISRKNMLLKSFLPDVVIPEKPLGQFIVECLEKFGDMTAIVEYHSGKEITFRELKAKTLEMVKLLWKAGLRKGDLVGLVLPFDIKYAPLFIAIIYCGGVLFGTKLLYKASIHNQLAAVKPALVVTTTDRYQEVSVDLETNVPSVKLCLSFDQLENIKPESLRKVEDDLPIYGNLDVHNDPVVIFQSSGTTGKPKRIVTTHYSMMAMIHITTANASLAPVEVVASVSPIIHVQSLESLFLYLSQGKKLVYATSLTAEQHLDVISTYKVNYIGVFNVNISRGMI